MEIVCEKHKNYVVVYHESAWNECPICDKDKKQPPEQSEQARNLKGYTDKILVADHRIKELIHELHNVRIGLRKGE